MINIIKTKHCQIITELFVNNFFSYFEFPISFCVSISTISEAYAFSLNENVNLNNIKNINNISLNIVFPNNEEITISYLNQEIHSLEIEYSINSEKNKKRDLTEYNLFEDMLSNIIYEFNDKLKITKLDKYFKLLNNINTF